MFVNRAVNRALGGIGSAGRGALDTQKPLRGEPKRRKRLCYNFALISVRSQFIFLFVAVLLAGACYRCNVSHIKHVGTKNISGEAIVSIDELRLAWIDQCVLCESQLANLDRQRASGLLKDDAGEPAWRWHKALEAWHSDLEKLLAEFPEESVGRNPNRARASQTAQQ